MSGAETAKQPDAPFSLRFVAAPQDLSPYVNTLYAFRMVASRMDDVMPAYSAQLLLFYEGDAGLEFAEGPTGRSSDACIVAPMLEAAPYYVNGPAAAIGISMTALGWAAFSRLAVDEHADRVFQAEDVVGEERSSRLRDIASGLREKRVEIDEALAQLVDLFRSGLSKLPQDHIALIRETTDWLNSDFNPDLDELLGRVPQSRRTVQRLLRRYFGQPPSRIVKRYRAIRAATMLATPNLPEEVRAQILGSFFDQSHMIRDIRRYTGRTPSALAAPDSALGKRSLSVEGYGAIELVAGNNG